jgi:hypothetical protein
VNGSEVKGMLGVSVRKVKGMTVKIETVTLIGNNRETKSDLLCVFSV